MLDKLQHNDLVITGNKKEILDYLDIENKLLNIKIITKQEFIDSYFGRVDTRALYYLIKKYNYKFDIAKMYLDNYLFNEDLAKELEENNLIIRTPLFKNNISRIVIFDVDIEPFLMKEIEKYNHIILKSESKNKTPKLYQFDTLEQEVDYVATRVVELIKGVDINKIFVVCNDKSYLNQIKRIFNLYNIPINLGIKKNIYGTMSVKKFLKYLKSTNNISLSLEKLHQDEIYNSIVDICNKYQFTDLDNHIIYAIEEELKQATIPYKMLKDAVNIIDFEQMSDNDAYYFIMSFNEGIVPVTIKDEDYLSDEKKQSIGLFTSYDLNKLEKERVINKITSFDNVIITYKNTYKAQEYYPSSLIEELNLSVEKEINENYGYSNKSNKLKLASMLDDFIKFNTTHKDLSLLFYNYKTLDYLKYDNKFKSIDKDKFRNYINNKITLSYSSLDNFYHCSFRFFLSNILKLDKYEETFMIYVGTLFHDILSQAFIDGFDFEKSFNEYIKEKEFSAKEEFFITRLKNRLANVIDIIKKQNEKTELTQELYEQKVTIAKHDEIDVNFVGIIDKVKYSEFDNKKNVAVIDYKTGNPHIELNNLEYGLSMQLPIYLYLLKYLFTEDINVAGFYLQKVVHDEIPFQLGKDYNAEVNKLYRLEGYSNDNIEILERFDSEYENSQTIKGMKMSSKGFYSYAKVLNDKQIDAMASLIDQKIDDAIKMIKNAEFNINPKVIDNVNIGCEYCKFKDICFKKEEDLVNLKSRDYEEFLGVRETTES